MSWRPALPLLLWALLLAVIARCWIMPLGSSFWVDETATAFVVHYGAAHPSFAVAPQVPASIYYVLPKAAEKLLGFSEAAYRIPSLLLMALALWPLAQLARRLIHPEAAWFALFACLALHGFNDQAADARPYAMGTAVAAWGLWFLVRWLDSGQWRDGLAFAVMAAVLWRVHLLFAPFYLVFVIYAALRMAGGKSAVRWPSLALVSGAVALALAPVAWRAAGLFHGAAAHVIVAPPGVRDLANSLKYGLLLVCGLGAWVVRQLRSGAAEPSPPWDTAGAALIVSWWLVPPVGMFAISWIAGNSVFVSRYYSLGLAGTALAAALFASRNLQAAQWKPAAAALGIGALVATGQWARLWPLHQHSDWRNAAQFVSRLAPSPATPVICPSPFVEARPPAWDPGYRLPGFLYAHLAVYPLAGRVVLFPFDDSPTAEAYGAQITQGTLAPAGRFVIYGGAGQAWLWWQRLALRPELAGWKSRRLGDFGDVTVVEFTR